MSIYMCSVQAKKYKAHNLTGNVWVIFTIKVTLILVENIVVSDQPQTNKQNTAPDNKSIWPAASSMQLLKDFFVSIIFPT